MAERVPSQVGPTDDGVVIITWTGLLDTDTGEEVRLPRYADKTVQVTGTFGVGGDVDMEGSNVSPQVWGQLHDPSQTVISIGDANPLVIAESPLFVRPNVAGGDGTTSLTVTIVAVVRGK